MEVSVIVFFSAVAVQIIFFFTFLIALSRKREEKQSTHPPVSVIVCAHDEEQNLKEIIPLLLEQDYPHFEVIIVDDRSNDASFDLLLAEARKDHRLRMVHVNRTPDHANGKKYGITLGIRAAAHEWILFTDADCRPASKNWIHQMSKQFNDQTQLVLGFSPYLKRSGLLNLFIRFEAFVTGFQYLSLALVKIPYMGVGRNLAYRKSLFLSNKGFYNFLHVTGGDDDLFVNQHATKENTQVTFMAESLVYSVPEITWKSYFRQKVRHLSTGKKYKLKHKLLLGLFALTWITTWFVGLPLVFVWEAYYWILGGLALHSIFLMITTYTLSKQLEEKFEVWTIPVLDFLYSIYYISTGLVALIIKKIRWRN